jgi:lipid II:glycine glycyltransferase (peptidoglycan interpeptide bridge formation enzyme)
MQSMRLIVNQDLSQARWDSSLLTRPDSHFLQSWAWGEFQTAIGNSIWRVAVEDQDQLITQLLIIKQSLGLGQSILYSPRGNFINPLASAGATSEAANLIIKFIRQLAITERCLLFRIDPPIESSNIGAKTFYGSIGFIKNPRKHIQPEHNQIIDLRNGVEKALNQARPKTRYNIGIAKKYASEHQLLISEYVGEAEVNAFLQLTHQTSGRSGFTSHSDKYYKTQIEILKAAGMLDVITVHASINLENGKIDDPVLGSILVAYFGNTATYIHGASSSEYRNMMAPYLLHSEAMRLAIARGIDYYDLGGVHPDPTHPWAGISRFKTSFGGTTIGYLGTLELPTNPILYKLYRLADKFR